MSASVSIYTLNKLDNTLIRYKKRILKHFYENLLDSDIKEQIEYQEFENRLIERKDNKNGFYNIKYDKEKCKARIWDKSYGFFQCSNGPTCGLFCKKHNSVELQNYGLVE